MPVRQDRPLAAPRHNRLLGFGLGMLALLLYGAITWRWTRGF